MRRIWRRGNQLCIRERGTGGKNNQKQERQKGATGEGRRWIEGRRAREEEGLGERKIIESETGEGGKRARRGEGEEREEREVGEVGGGGDREARE